MLKAFMPSAYYKSLCQGYLDLHRDKIDFNLATMAMFLSWKDVAEKIAKHENLRDVEQLDIWLSFKV